MRSRTQTTRIIILIALLAGIVLLTGLSFPRQVGALQSTDPAPTITPTFLPGEEPLKSGETGSLILGAAAILLIIIVGVVTQRIMLKRDP
jgi:hypothetical protein